MLIFYINPYYCADFDQNITLMPQSQSVYLIGVSYASVQQLQTTHGCRANQEKLLTVTQLANLI